MSEDLAMRTLARAVKAQGEFASESAYFSFLCTILVNLHRDDLRLKGANALVFMDAVPDVEDEHLDPGTSLDQTKWKFHATMNSTDCVYTNDSRKQG